MVNSSVQMVPKLTWFEMIFQLYHGMKVIHIFSRKHTANLEFWSFPWLVICSVVRYSLLMLNSGSEPQLPISCAIKTVNNQYTYNIQLFCLSLPVQYSVNYMRYSTLYYKIGFVLDDFAQLLVNVSVLSTFKVG